MRRLVWALQGSKRQNGAVRSEPCSGHVMYSVELHARMRFKTSKSTSRAAPFGIALDGEVLGPVELEVVLDVVVDEDVSLDPAAAVARPVHRGPRRSLE